jgi:hypothetical protein
MGYVTSRTALSWEQRGMLWLASTQARLRGTLSHVFIAHCFADPACGALFCWRRGSRFARLASALALRCASLTLRSMFMVR